MTVWSPKSQGLRKYRKSEKGPKGWPQALKQPRILRPFRPLSHSGLPRLLRYPKQPELFPRTPRSPKVQVSEEGPEGPKGPLLSLSAPASCGLNAAAQRRFNCATTATAMAEPAAAGPPQQPPQTNAQQAHEESGPPGPPSAVAPPPSAQEAMLAARAAQRQADQRLYAPLEEGQTIRDRFADVEWGLPMLQHRQQLHRRRQNCTIALYNQNKTQTILDYKKSIEEHGLIPGVRGAPWLVDIDHGKKPTGACADVLQYRLLSFDKLTQATKLAIEDPANNDNIKVIQTLANGLQGCDIFDHRLPDDVCESLAVYRNAFHVGSKTSWVEVIKIT
eukprot:3436883-Pyramimonas_sp.AAC.1